MSTIAGGRPQSFRRLAPVPPSLVILGVCLGPYVSRLRWPSLYADDIDRVAQLRTGTLGGILLEPFNEHLAPLFQSVSWLTWQVAGDRLARAPLAFTLASYLPFVLTLGLLAWVLRRETRSTAAAVSGLAVFAVSWLAVETVFWYSASSFMWSLLATLAAWAAAEPAGPTRVRRAVAAAASAAAPAFSLIGILAGPVAVVRVLASGGRRAWADAVAPVVGTLLFLAVYWAGHDRGVVAANIEQNAGILPGLVAASRAPAAALVPAVFGLRTLPSTGPAGALLTLLTAAAAVVLLVRAYRSPADRPAILGGLALIGGGYVFTFCARAGVPGRALLETQRYHLFPMLGLVLLLASALRRAFRPWADRPAAGLWVAAGFAATLLVVHQGEMRGRARFLRFPDQARTLAALDRLGDLCARSGVTRTRALAALDPVETAWAPEGRSVVVMLGPCAGVSRVPDALVKPTLLAALSPSDRRSVCGGMDASPYLTPVDDPSPAGPLSAGRPVALFRVREVDGRYVAAGWPAFIEYELATPDRDRVYALGLTGRGVDAGGLVEVWWRGEPGNWSETRSVRLRPRVDASRPVGSWRLPLDRVPHCDPTEVRRIRLLFHTAGPVALESPRLVR